MNHAHRAVQAFTVTCIVAAAAVIAGAHAVGLLLVYLITGSI